MKKYTTPEAELLKFRVEDVLAASAQGFNPDAEEGAGWNAGTGNNSGFPLD